MKPRAPSFAYARRRWLFGAASFVAAPAVWATSRVSTASDARALAFEHLHTGETLSVVYAVGDRYVPESLGALARLLRDHRTGDTHAIDPALFDQLHALANVTGAREPFRVISGYRSPRTNAMLASRSSGVATGSLHLEGRAIDIRLPGVPLADLREAALSLRAGGVGFYPASDFVHIDTGRVRTW